MKIKTIKFKKFNTSKKKVKRSVKKMSKKVSIKEQLLRLKELEQGFNELKGVLGFNHDWGSTMMTMTLGLQKTITLYDIVSEIAILKTKKSTLEDEVKMLRELLSDATANADVIEAKRLDTEDKCSRDDDDDD